MSVILKTSYQISQSRVNYLIEEYHIDPAIAQVDLEMIKWKISLQNVRFDVEQAEIEYKRYLCLVKKYPCERLVPNKQMDMIWHEHILSTKAYHADCLTVFGEYLHHYPFLGLSSHDDLKRLHNAFQRTMNLYNKMFYVAMSNEPPSECDCETTQ
jgi:hypothetical protein